MSCSLILSLSRVTVVEFYTTFHLLVGDETQNTENQNDHGTQQPNININTRWKNQCKTNHDRKEGYISRKTLNKNLVNSVWNFTSFRILLGQVRHNKRVLSPLVPEPGTAVPTGSLEYIDCISTEWYNPANSAICWSWGAIRDVS